MKTRPILFPKRPANRDAPPGSPFEAIAVERLERSLDLASHRSFRTHRRLHRDGGPAGRIGTRAIVPKERKGVSSRDHVLLGNASEREAAISLLEIKT